MLGAPMNTSSRAPFAVWIVSLLLLVAAAIWSWSTFAAPDNSPGDAPNPRAAGTTSREAAAPLGTTVPAAVDAAAPRELVTPAAATPPSPPPARLRGRVLDSRGLALAGVPIGWMPAAAFQRPEAPLSLAEPAGVATSDLQGGFELTAPEAGEHALVTGPGWLTLRSTAWPAFGGQAELLVIAAPAKQLTGRTTRADDGTPLADVTILPSLLLLTEFPRPLEHTAVPFVTPAASDAEGNFRLLVPLAAGVDLVFSHAGFERRRVPSLDAVTGHLDVALAPLSPAAGRIHGRVTDAEGPLAGVRVQLGFDQQTLTDARGEFSFELPRRPSRLIASCRGWMPIVREGIGAEAKELDLRFERRALTITGELRSAAGAPVPGWRLDLVDPLRDCDHRPIELDSRDGEQPAECLALTDAAGRFVVGGLADRSYQLLAYDPATLVTVVSPPVAAGSEGIVLTVPADALLDELRGIVVDRRGSPVADAGVQAWLSAPSVGNPLSGATTTTGTDGRFVLRDAPRRGVRLGISKPGFVYAVQMMEQWLTTGSELRVELLRLCAVRVEGPAEAVVEFLDGAGNRLHAESHSQSMMFSTNAVTLHDGKSPVMVLPETTATMRWRRGDQELGRKPVSLDPSAAVTLLIAGD